LDGKVSGRVGRFVSNLSGVGFIPTFSVISSV